MAQFAIDPGRTAPLDMQTCFAAGSPLAASAGEPVAGRINRLAAACRGARIPVVWTRQPVRPDGSNTGILGQLVPPIAGVINDDAPAAALRPLMDVRPDEIVVGKPRFGSLYGTDLEVILRSRGVDTLIGGGINTNEYVRTTRQARVSRGVPQRRHRQRRHRGADAGPDAGSGRRLSGILAAILALPIQEQR